MNKLELSALLKDVRRSEKESVVEDGSKIAVIGACSIQYFVRILRYYLRREGLNCKIYEGEYGGINMDVFDMSSALYAFEPDYVIVLPFYTDIKDIPPLLSDRECVMQYVDGVKVYYEKLWTRLGEIPGVRILQSNFVIPPIRILGNLEYQEPYSSNEFFKCLNEMLIRERPTNVTIVDVDALSNNIGKYNWFDYPSYFLNKAAVRLEYMPEIVMCFVRQIRALQGNTRKCLVLDLDNTIWGGIVGDDGCDGIQIDPNNAVGEAYRFFQGYCQALRKRGVILAVCSKNEDTIAREPFEKNENMILKLDDISCFIANWENKADNLHRIAHELNIGIDSLVFFDDNPAERKIIKQFIPEVYVVDVPEDPALYVLQMEKEQPFEWLQITKEDIERTKSYGDNRKRQKLQDSFVNYDDYLKALEMKGKVGRVGKEEITRFTQLINKSNQFNLRTVRYSESDIEAFAVERDVRCLYEKLSDQYSDYGIISCVILKKDGDSCFIDTWVMSCRVLKRGVEDMMYSHIIKAAKEMGCTSIKAEYIRTKKNKMVETFYDSLGFEPLGTKETDRELVKYYSTDKFDYIPTYYIEEEEL